MDAIVDAAGVGPALAEALRAARNGARASVIALHKKPVEIDPMVIMSRGITLRGSMGCEGEFGQVLGFMASGVAPYARVITHRFPLERIDEALKMPARPDEAVKVPGELPA